MQFTANVQDLLDALNTVTRALAARPAKAILESVLLTVLDDSVVLTCSDGSLTIESTIVAEVKEMGQAALAGKLFTEMIRKQEGGSVTVTCEHGRPATIVCGKCKSSMTSMNSMEYPEMQEINASLQVQIQQNRLRDMISRVVFAIANDETRQILTGCLLEVTRDEARIVALDGYRLAMQKLFQPFQLPEDTEKLRAVVPGRVMNELSKILPEDETFCTLSFDKNRMQVSFGNTKFSTVLLAGEFIDYQKILPAAFKTQAKAKRLDVYNAIDRASLMAREGKNNLIRMSFEQDRLTISSNAEMGAVNEEVACTLVGDPIEIAFNAKYLVDVIRNITDDELCMKFNSNVSPCVFVPEEGEQFVYLILPVRIFQ